MNLKRRRESAAFALLKAGQTGGIRDLLRLPDRIGRLRALLHQMHREVN